MRVNQVDCSSLRHMSNTLRRNALNMPHVRFGNMPQQACSMDLYAKIVHEKTYTNAQTYHSFLFFPTQQAAQLQR